MKSVEHTAYTFQKRRKKTWRSARRWLVPMAIGLTGSLYIDEFTAKYPRDEGLFEIGCAVLFVAPLLRLRYLVHDEYLCPVCEKVPMAPETSFWGGIDLNPKLCPNCGAKLK